MSAEILKITTLIFISFFINSCSFPQTVSPAQHANKAPHSIDRCHAIYDAGSSGTRLILYHNKNDQWLTYHGEKVAALADPIRAQRGKNFNDLNTVINAVVAALDSIRQNAPLDKQGKAQWQTFDWKTQCQLVSVQVLATAGMRIAEYENRQGSRILWQRLRQKLQEKVGSSVSVTTRTLSGFEEGLFAWLAVKETQKDNTFGIAEMGGASAQITFPCSHCSTENNAIHPIIIDNKVQKMYSYSFLGLGQDEATKTLAMPAECAYGIATQQPNWNRNHCYKKINIAEFSGLRDPYNFRAGLRGSHHQIPAYQAEIKQWILTGAFNYTQESDIQNCCESKGQCYQANSACFRPIYLRKYLHLIGIPPRSEKNKASWTRGAMLCAETHCLAKLENPLTCRWSAQGCLN